MSEPNREETIEGVKRAFYAYLTRWPEGTFGDANQLIREGVESAFADFLRDNRDEIIRQIASAESHIRRGGTD